MVPIIWALGITATASESGLGPAYEGPIPPPDCLISNARQPPRGCLSLLCDHVRNLNALLRHSTYVPQGWKTYPPYATKYPPEVYRKKCEGGCFGNAVRFQISKSAPLDAKYCHCTTCQHLNGAPVYHFRSGSGYAAVYHGRRKYLDWNGSGCNLPQRGWHNHLWSRPTRVIRNLRNVYSHARYIVALVVH